MYFERRKFVTLQIQTPLIVVYNAFKVTTRRNGTVRGKRDTLDPWAWGDKDADGCEEDFYMSPLYHLHRKHNVGETMGRRAIVGCFT